MITLFLLILAQDRPVIRLDEALIKGNIRKPNLVEIKGSQLQEIIEEKALKNLLQLEKRILDSKPSLR